MTRLSRVATRAYCISPYKTATTFVSGLFSSFAKVKHEPMHYLSLKRLNDERFLAKRARFLSLDLECSGFLAAKLPAIRNTAPTAPVLFIIRDPSQWIGSVITYLERLSKYLSFNYVARLYFDPITTYPIESFYELTIDRQQHIAKSLLEYWVTVYRSANEDQDAMIVRIDDLDQRIFEIGEFLMISGKPNISAWRRSGRSKNTFTLGQYIDISEFQGAIAEFGY